MTNYCVILYNVTDYCSLLRIYVFSDDVLTMVKLIHLARLLIAVDAAASFDNILPDTHEEKQLDSKSYFGIPEEVDCC